MRKPITEQLGPAKPLNGKSTRQVQRERHQAVKKAFRELRDVELVAERFGLTVPAVEKVLTRAGRGGA